MKTKTKIIIFILIMLNAGVIYLAFLIGEHKAILTNGQISCLVEDVRGEEIVVSQEQAVCLAKKGEIEIISGSGYPLKKPTDSATLSLKSSKSVLLENNSMEFENKMRNLGVKVFRK